MLRITAFVKVSDPPLTASCSPTEPRTKCSNYIQLSWLGVNTSAWSQTSNFIGKRRFMDRRSQETEQRHALFNAETDAETTQVWFQNYFMNSSHNRRGSKYYASGSRNTSLFTNLTCAQRARVLLPVALASVSSGFVALLQSVFEFEQWAIGA